MTKDNNITKFLFEYIESNTKRLEASHRGGGIEVDAEEYTGIEGALISAYQNYLGGGMLGSIQVSTNVKLNERGEILADALKQYYYNITNDIVADYDEWASSESYTKQQARPASGY